MSKEIRQIKVNGKWLLEGETFEGEEVKSYLFGLIKRKKKSLWRIYFIGVDACAIIFRDGTNEQRVITGSVDISNV